ncbi:MAG: hypothetical protein F6J90_21520 [Moorea sp. SIOASIH]|nr:hypothetical protein [Moorena sp. SIOASIH]
MTTKLPPITPGDILLEEFIKPFGISENQLAQDIHVPVTQINAILTLPASKDAGILRS